MPAILHAQYKRYACVCVWVGVGVGVGGGGGGENIRTIYINNFIRYANIYDEHLSQICSLGAGIYKITSIKACVCTIRILTSTKSL
jgi:hypothetical protein